MNLKFDEEKKEVELSDLHQSRIDALDGTAEAIRKIKKQHELTERVGESGLAEISEAVNCAQEAMFYLATAAAEDDDAIRRILTDYGMEIFTRMFRQTGTDELRKGRWPKG